MFQLWTSGPQKPTTTLAQRKRKAVTNVGSLGIFRRNEELKRPRRRKTGTDVDDPRIWSVVHHGKDADDSGFEGYAFVVTSLDAVRDGDGLGRGEPVVDLDFGWTTWPALVDSGACSNVMGENEIVQLQREGLKVSNLQHCSKRL